MRIINWNRLTKRYRSVLFSPITLLLIGIASNQIAGDTPEDMYQRAWNSMLTRVEGTALSLKPGYFPMLGDNISGMWEAYRDPKWTGGFWVGMLWLAYENTNDEKYLKWAIAWNDSILGYESEDNHDRGFVYFYSSVYGYRLIQDTVYLKSGFKAADKLVSMSGRINKVIAQNQKDRTNIIIDTMVNLELLWWAAAEAKELGLNSEKYLRAGFDHADATGRDFVRADGSTWQSVHYDTMTAEIISKHTHQGYADSTCWSRGQSWGLYGFVQAYRTTGKKEYLEGAHKLAQYIILNIPEDGVPWYDYNDPGIHYRKKDTSAGAIAACAFIKLSGLVSDPIQKNEYARMAEKIVTGLVSNHLTPFVGVDSPAGILRNGCYQIFANNDSETIWGDFYLMEALALLLNKEAAGDY